MTYNIEKRALERIGDAMKVHTPTAPVSSKACLMFNEELQERHKKLKMIADEIVKRKASEIVKACDKLNKSHLDAQKVTFNNFYLDNIIPSQFKKMDLEIDKILSEITNLYHKYYEEVLPYFDTITCIIKCQNVTMEINNESSKKYCVFHELIFLFGTLTESFEEFHGLANALQKPNIDLQMRNLSIAFFEYGSKYGIELGLRTENLIIMTNGNIRNSLAYNEYKDQLNKVSS